VSQTWAEVLPYLGDRIERLVASVPEPCLERLEEVRLRAGRPLIICYGGREGFIAREGGLCPGLRAAYVVTPEDCQAAVQRLTRSSVYALEEELRNGYLTLPGGHRAGFVGRAVVEGGRVRSLRHLCGLNLRLTREVKGAADAVLPALVDGRFGLCSTLVLSPPQAGKTTLLRDLCRQVSEGRPGLGLPGRKVVIVDERSELAGCWEGIPQCDVGPRTDVLDACPKAEGVSLVLRAMSPEVIVTDELGRPEDVTAVRETVRTGVTVVASAHAADLQEAALRPALAPLLVEGCFSRAVILSRRRGPGTVERILRLDGGGREQVAAAGVRAAGGGERVCGGL
jgi:stage III sporulation protein AA